MRSLIYSKTKRVVSKVSLFLDSCRFVLKYCPRLPTLLLALVLLLVKSVQHPVSEVRGLQDASGRIPLLEDVESEGWDQRPYERFSKFKSARQKGLKGLLAGAEGGGEALGLRASVGG